MKLSGFRKLLIKYHRGEVNKAERYVVDSWYDSFGESKTGVPGLETPEAVETSRLRMYRKTGIPLPSIPWYKRYQVAAAAAILVICSLLFWQQQSTTLHPKQPEAKLVRTISTRERQVKRIQLPDSTTLWLNANSRLTLQPDYGVQNRRIELTGEAFFEVKQDKTRPFIVQTRDIAVKVLGTSFNVSAYDGLETVKVSVSTGAVQVRDTADRRLSELKAGQGLSYYKSSKSYLLSAVSVKNNRSWTEGKVVLQKAPYEELVLVLHNLYGLHLESHSNQARSIHYNLTLRSDQNEKDLLALISSITKTHYKKEGNHVTLY